MHCGAILKCKTRCHALIICVPAPSTKKAAFRSGCSLADLLRLAAARERVEHFPEFPACCNSISGGVGGGGGGRVHNEESLCEGGHYFPGTPRICAGDADLLEICCWEFLSSQDTRTHPQKAPR